MKKTPFNEIHKRLGAKMVEFAGFEMPVQYSGIVAEHRQVRESVGVFDVSHMGEFYVGGKNAEDFLQENTLNDVRKLTCGSAQYTALVNSEGRLLDDLIVYRLADAGSTDTNSFMIVANASNIQKDFAAFSARVRGDVSLVDASDKTALLSVQGPKSAQTLQRLTDTDLSTIPYYHFVKGKVSGVDAIISRTGYTGEIGFEVFFEPKANEHEKVWYSIFDAGRDFGILPIGLGARDTLRLEMGYCLYGNDIDETTNPIEAGLGWITKLDKGNFLGRGAVLKAKEGVTRKLAGFKMDADDGSAGRGSIPRHGYEIYSTDGSPQKTEPGYSRESKKIGRVTSGTFSPTLGIGIGMGYVEVPHAAENARVAIDIRGKTTMAHIVKLPFVPGRARDQIKAGR